jgi:ADP-heptose:LPS heptosyltransferase
MTISSTKEVLLLRFSSLGDVVQTNFTAMKIKEKHPDWKLTWLVDSMYADIVRSQPWVDEVIEWNRRKDGNRGFIRVLNEVRKRKFDILVDMHNSDRSCLFSLLSNIPQRYANRKRLPFAHTDYGFEDLRGDIPLYKCCKYLIAPLCAGSKTSKIHEQKTSPVITLSIGASKIQKRWSDERWIEFCLEAVSKGYYLVLLGAGIMEKQSAEHITSEVKSDLITNLVDELSFLELIKAIDIADVAVSGDTGSLHIARALGKPTIGLFGPTLLDKKYTSTLPLSYYSKCQSLDCNNWECKIKCLESIPAKDVLNGVEKILKELKK